MNQSRRGPQSTHEARTSAKPPEALVANLHRLLRPLVRLLVAQGITYPWFSQCLKSIFIEVADTDFLLDGKKSTDSRVNLLTGVHRKDIKRLRQSAQDEAVAPHAVSLGGQLVAQWTGNLRFLDKKGQPLPLPRLSADSDLSFEGLVKSVSKDIRARAVLDEWLRLGAVSIDGHDRVCLRHDAFVPEKGFEERACCFGQNIGDHIAVAVHNLLGEKPTLLERSVCYSSLTPESIQELAELSRKTGIEGLQSVSKQAMRLQKQDRKKSNSDYRINFGVYCFGDHVAGEDKAPDKNDRN